MGTTSRVAPPSASAEFDRKDRGTGVSRLVVVKLKAQLFTLMSADMFAKIPYCPPFARRNVYA